MTADNPAQQLAGLFAGGMPKLKKTGGPGGHSEFFSMLKIVVRN